MYAHVGGDTSKHQIANRRAAQNQLKIRGKEGALTGFVDDRFAVDGREFRDDLPSRFTTYQYSSTRPLITDSRSDLTAAPLLVCRQVGQIGPVAFPGMHHMAAPSPSRRENFSGRFDGCASKRDVVTHLVDIAA